MFIEDFSTAVRRIRSKPSQSGLVVAILGAGLGAVLFVLTLVNALIVEPLPYEAADRLVAIGAKRDSGIGIGSMRSFDYRRLQGELRSFDAMGVYHVLPVSITRGKTTTQLTATALSQSVLPMLGATPLIGRGFVAEEDREGAPLTLLISERVWRTQFNADPGINGQLVQANGEPAIVVGVLPAGFGFPFISDVWMPVRMPATGSTGVDVVARLAPGVSAKQAADELETVTRNLGAELEADRIGREYIIKALSYRFVNESTRGLIWLMLGASLLVLLLACANVSNLHLVETLNRRRELALRNALGAGTARLVRQQFAECLLLSLAAAAVALILAQLGGLWIKSMYASTDAPTPLYLDFSVDVRVLALALGAALLTTLVSGLLPAWRAAGSNLQGVLREGEHGSSAGRLGQASRLLVVFEVVLTVVLLIGAGTFISGLDRLLALDLGTRAAPDSVLTARIDLFPERYPDPRQRVRLLERLSERINAHPTVLSASLGTTVPGAALGSHEEIGAVGMPEPPGGYPRAQMGAVDPRFMETYDVSLVAGRFIEMRDDPDSLPVAVVDQRLARRLWGERDPVGLTLALNPNKPSPDRVRIIGVVDNLHLDKATEPPLPSVLVPLAQHPPESVFVSVRARGQPEAFASTLSALVRAESPDVPVYAVRTQAAAIDLTRTGVVLLTRIFTGVGLIALLLAATGLYGVLAYTVRLRTREIGIRRAIGASSGHIVGDVLRRIAGQLGWGLGIGLVLAVPWSLALQNPGLQTQGLDLKVFASVLATILLAVATASLVPIWRALRVDPADALRHG